MESWTATAVHCFCKPQRNQSPSHHNRKTKPSRLTFSWLRSQSANLQTPNNSLHHNRSIRVWNQKEPLSPQTANNVSSSCRICKCPMPTQQRSSRDSSPWLRSKSQMCSCSTSTASNSALFRKRRTECECQSRTFTNNRSKKKSYQIRAASPADRASSRPNYWQKRQKEACSPPVLLFSPRFLAAVMVSTTKIYNTK